MNTINLNINFNNIEESFKRIAKELMNDWILKIEKSSYRIAEIEFYLKNDKHNDEYVHGHKLQKETGKWYIHASGMDLTFGNRDFFGGILIRAISNIDTDDYTYGPINTLTEIFSSFKNVYSNTYTFGLVKIKRNKETIEKPIAARRVGLNKSKNPDMYKELYRYLILPKEKHTDKTGIANAMKEQNYSDEEINKIWK